MKKTDLAKADAKKLMNQMGARDSQFGAANAVPLDRREQRERDRALGLVPFAVKLNSDLVKPAANLGQGTPTGSEPAGRRSLAKRLG